MKSAAENGDASAQHNMGMWHQEVAKDLETAKWWYQRATANEHEGAKEALESLARLKSAKTP